MTEATLATVPLVVRILGLGDGTPTAYDGLWLTGYDPTRPGTSPDGRPMTAHLTGTADRSRAYVFSSIVEVQQWLMRTTPRGVRPDGQPDRPITAFAIMVEAV